MKLHLVVLVVEAVPDPNEQPSIHDLMTCWIVHVAVSIAQAHRQDLDNLLLASTWISV